MRRQSIHKVPLDVTWNKNNQQGVEDLITSCRQWVKFEGFVEMRYQRKEKEIMWSKDSGKDRMVVRELG